MQDPRINRIPSKARTRIAFSVIGLLVAAAVAFASFFSETAQNRQLGRAFDRATAAAAVASSTPAPTYAYP